MISDLHLEFKTPKYTFPKIEAKCKNLFLLGDIGLPFINEDYTNFLEEIAKSFEHIFIVLGNHEFYRSTMEDVFDYFEKIS